MVIHRRWSHHEWVTRCGARVASESGITSDNSKVTCKTCLKAIRGEGIYSKGDKQ